MHNHRNFNNRNNMSPRNADRIFAALEAMNQRVDEAFELISAQQQENRELLYYAQQQQRAQFMAPAVAATPAYWPAQHNYGDASVCRQQTGDPQSANANLKMLGLFAVVGIAGILGGLYLADKWGDRN